jgi:hypothetical protein
VTWTKLFGAAGAAIALTLSACGSSAPKPKPAASTSASSTNPASAAGAAPAGNRVASELGPYLVRNGEGGFSVQPGQETASPNLAGYTYPASGAKPPAADLRQLGREGFVSALAEGPSTSAGVSGLSTVIRFATPAGARSEQASEITSDIAQAGRGPLRRFTVAAIPGLVGFTSASTSPSSPQAIANVLFVEGSCLVVIGDGPPNDTYTQAQAKVPVATAALAVYKRTAKAHDSCTAR